MNRKLVFNYLGKISIASGALMIVPMLCAAIYKEYNVLLAFLGVAVFSVLLGFAVSRVSKPQSQFMYVKEGFTIVALAWIVMSFFGALPFVICGDIPNLADAFFETVSGYTTTGATILSDIESLSKSALLWRSFTHWVGGMGVIVFVMAILPNLSDRSVHIMRAEMPGPIFGKLVPRSRDTAKILYIIYIAITFIMWLFLRFGGMPVYDCFVHSFATAGTGGFSCNADSILSYSPYLQWVITVFMILFGINFNLYYYFIAKRSLAAFKSTELAVFIGIIVFSATAICINISHMFGSVSEAFRHSAFAVSSIISTTGYATVDFELWPEFSKSVLFVLMFIGGCAGSTGGGLKVSRMLLFFKMICSEIRHMLHPRSVTTVRLDGKNVDSSTLHSVSTYFVLFFVCYFIIYMILSLLQPSYGFTENFTAIASCLINVGPGFGKIGPTSSFAGYSLASKLLLSFTMLLGRLEIFPLLLTFMPATWTKD